MKFKQGDTIQIPFKKGDFLYHEIYFINGNENLYYKATNQRRGNVLLLISKTDRFAKKIEPKRISTFYSTPGYLTLSQASHLLGKARTTLIAAIKRKKLLGIKVMDRWFIEVNSCHNYKGNS